MCDFAGYQTEIGYISLRYSEDLITEIKILPQKLKEDGIKTQFTEMVYYQISEYLQGKRKVLNFGYTYHGTEFQQKVWRAVTSIPYGQTKSYKEIAEIIGNPKAYRAVGLANNKNPVLLAVPCHRVIGASGQLTGYAAGVDVKKYLLDLEKKVI